MRRLTLSSLGSTLAVPLLAAGGAAAQTITFRPPEDIIRQSACGDWPGEVSETDVAVGKSDVMAVWLNGTKDVGFAIRSSALPAGVWSCPALIPKVFDNDVYCFTPPSPSAVFDSLSYPSVAYSPATEENLACYMACALAKFVEPSGDKHECIVVSYYEPAAASPAWSPWMLLDMKTTSPCAPFCVISYFDKPFITAGASGEFYVVYIDEVGNGRYSHTTNGGRSSPRGPTSGAGDWICGQDITTPGVQAIGNGFAMHPYALDDSGATPGGENPLNSLYCMFLHSEVEQSYGFVRGIDQPDTTVKFKRVKTEVTVQKPSGQLRIHYNDAPWLVSAALPGNPNCNYMPQIAVDPQAIEDPDDDLLYVISHDAPFSSSANVNAVLNVAMRTPGTADEWSWIYPEPGVLLNSDPTESAAGCGDGYTDQWLPILTVDEQGRAHAIFYDDRAYEQDDGSAPAGCEAARWNLTYSLTTNAGATFTESARPEIAGEPWLDYSFPYGGPREYTGLDFTTKLGATYLWATVSGTKNDGLPANSVIWGQLIIVQ